MEQHYCANGVDIYVEPNNNMHSFCVSVYIKAGSMYENENNNGIAHLYEHLVFRNVKKFYGEDFYNLLSKNGLYFNGCTYREFIQFEFAGIRESFPFLLDVISKLFLNFDLLGYEIKAEKKRIKAEIRENDERRTITNYYDKLVWAGTSLENTISGYCKTIDRISQKVLNEYKEYIISKENFFFYVTGDVSENQIEDLIACVSEINISDKNIGYTNVAPVPQNFFNRKPDISVNNSYWTYVKIGFDIDNSKCSMPIRDIIYSALFENDDALIYQGLSEKSSLIYSYDSTLEQYKNISNIKVQFEVDKKNLYSAIEKTIDAFYALKKGEFDFDAVMMKRRSVHQMRMDNAVNLNWDLAYERHIMDEKDYIDELKNISKQQIVDASNEIFKTHNLTIAIKGRKREIDIEKINEILKKID